MMKALKLIVVGMALFLSGTLYSQVSVSLNIGTPPMWGPSGYADARFYYLPDVEAYYDIQSSMFIFFEGGTWVHRSYLPSRYGNYDLYGGYKVVMTDYHGNTPYTHFNEHRSHYARGYHGKAQRNIGERPGRGNSGQNNYHNDNHGNKGGGPGNNKNAGRGNDKNAKGDRGHGGGNDKKK
jgi:hypothetical protein